MDSAAVPSPARRTVRRILLAGVAGIAWLSFSAAPASALQDPVCSPSPCAATVAVAPASQDPDGADPAVPAEDFGSDEQAERSPAPAADPSSGADSEDTAPAEPEPAAPPAEPEPAAPAPAEPEPGAPVDPEPGAPAPEPERAAPAPDPAAMDPAAPVTDPAAAEPVMPGQVPAAPAQEPLVPALDALSPVLAAPGADGVLPVADPAILLTDPLPVNPVVVPGSPDSSVPASPSEVAAAPEVSSGPLPGSPAAIEAAAASPASVKGPAGTSVRSLPPLYIPPPGSYPALLAEKPVASGGPGPAPTGAPAQGGGVPAGHDGTGPLHGDPRPPAPEALPAAPGLGSGNGQSTNGPAGTAAWLPSLYFYLPATGADPIRGPLQHAYSAVSADPGSSPD